ncbi:MAG: lamin tail domain-containing protein, partial [Clostridia bacterium]|nr:lamin tail domain-containing protein [Clostridia bacterium]
MAKKPANKANKPFRTRDIMIAAILAVCLLASVGIMILIQSSVGKPVFYDGDIQNICLRINEICTKNRSIIPDPNGEFSDYIEIYNYGDEVLLEGFGLATEKGSVARYTFGDVRIAKDEYKIIYLDGKEVPFRLSSSGKEYIGLLAPDGSVIDSVETVAMLADEVMIYTDTGFFVSEEASPGLPNTKEGVEAFRKGQADESPDIVINEILTDNCSALPDFEGEFVDIIEILNVSGKTVSTAGYFISDSLEKRNRSALPDRNLEPGEIMLIFASGKETVADNGEFHTDFGLSSGETVVLSKGGKYVCVGVKRCGTNMSLSRVRNEDGEFVYEVMRTTVGFPNDESGMEALAESMIDRTLPIVINEVLLASDETAYGGKIRDVVELCNISGGTVSTKGWHLSDSEKDPCRYELPERELAPGEILVIYADDYGTEVSTGFALSSGDSVYLTSPSGKRGDAVECMPAGRGKSWSLSSRDASGFGYTSGAISIGHANDSAGALSYDKDARPATVEISEAVSVNTKYLAGSYGTYTDFVELHNNSDKEIDLSGWYLSDDAEKPRKGSLDGLKIPAGGYKIVLLSKETKNVRKGYLILNFAISLHGETLVLSHGDEVVDTMPVPALGENTAFGRADG